MPDAPSIAVAISVYPAYLKYVMDAIASVEAQTLPPAEKWLLCDRCFPPADMPAGWKRLAGEWHEAAAGRRELTGATACEWCAMLDADDAYLPGFLAHMAAAADAAGPRVGILYPDLANCDINLQHPDLMPMRPWDAGELQRRNFVPTHSLWRTAMLREIGGWRSAWRMDDALTAQACAAVGWSGQWCPGCAIQVRSHPEQRVNTRMMPSDA